MRAFPRDPDQYHGEAVEGGHVRVGARGRVFEGLHDAILANRKSIGQDGHPRRSPAVLGRTGRTSLSAVFDAFVR
ncbi:hypothetical protein GCM10017567_23190 [Amycolatopsis bullii]|uniref:Uncharacterized protein n=1 Tax=Amycolatopsis bullii TaxID=941987 RepID=A0ABQ3K863_9PSEU|nr:hypothetical protein GCM10017567_23190 [Amycolatopsis bullii]